MATGSRIPWGSDLQEINILEVFGYLLPLIEGACVVITCAFITFRAPLLREGLLHSQQSYRSKLLLIVLFSAFAIYGTHAGMIISPGGSLAAVTETSLGKHDAILNFRDMAVLISGLLLGPWVGTSVGMVAGFERYQLGGFTAMACGLTTAILGLLSGMAHQWTNNLIIPVYAVLIAILAVFLQKILIIWLSTPLEIAIQLVNKTLFPMLFINASGCYLFIYIIHALDSEQREKLSYFKAQLEPHFLMNTLNAIRSLIRTDPDRARTYISRLGKFMQEIQRYVREYTISISEELEQVERFIDFQQLRFPNKLIVNYDISEHFPLDFQVPPKMLLTLVENSLTHGRHHDQTITVQIQLSQVGRRIFMEIKDNGKGITMNKLKLLGKKTVQSAHPGGGHALFNLFQMLRLSYGANAKLDIYSKENQGTVVKLSLPY